MRIQFLGDICLSWNNLSSQKLKALADKINVQLGKSDYCIANLEGVISVNDDLEPIIKAGPNLKMTTEKLSFFKYLNVNAYTLANNHTGDFGERGIIDTIDYLESIGKKYVGAALNYNDTYKPLRLEITNKKFSVLSVCENEFGIAQQDKIGAAGFKWSVLKNLIKQEKKWANYVIVIFHGGSEHYPFPSPEQRERYRLIADLGVNVIIGMHSHCPVGLEKYNNSLIFYGIGNFYFPRNTPIFYENWYIGYTVTLELDQNNNIGYSLQPYRFTDNGDWLLLPYEQFNDYLNEINKSIQDDKMLKNLFNGWASFIGKRNFDILKSHLIDEDTKRNFALITNLFTCEIHTEVLKAYVNLKFNEIDSDYFEELEYIKKLINWAGKSFFNRNYDNPPKSTVIIWGFSERAVKLLNELENDPERINIFFIDRDFYKQGFTYKGYFIKSPDISTSYKNAIFYICTQDKYVDSIKTYLMANNINEKQIRRYV